MASISLSFRGWKGCVIRTCPLIVPTRSAVDDVLQGQNGGRGADRRALASGSAAASHLLQPCRAEPGYRRAPPSSERGPAHPPARGHTAPAARGTGPALSATTSRRALCLRRMAGATSRHRLPCRCRPPLLTPAASLRP